MTKPNSTDAGGVTEDREQWLLQQSQFTNAEVNRMLDRAEKAEAALATLTREKQSLQDGLDCALAQLHYLGYPVKARLIREGRDPSALEPATPPAPLPGGQGPVEALRRELIDLLRKAASDEELSWDESLHRIADRLEQGGEGREG